MSPHYEWKDIVTCMRISATMLELADHDWPEFNKNNREQANLLRAAADDIEAHQNVEAVI